MTHPILDLPMQDNDAGAATIRDYLKLCLEKLIKEGASFSGKRPFGSGGWEHELYIPLVKAGLVDGVIDDDGYIDSCDDEAADKMLIDAIKAL